MATTEVLLELKISCRFSQQELKDGKSHVTKLTDKWFQDIQASPLISDLTDSDDETVELNLRVESR